MDDDLRDAITRFLTEAADKSAAKGATADDVLTVMLGIYVASCVHVGASEDRILFEVSEAIHKFKEHQKTATIEYRPPLGKGSN